MDSNKILNSKETLKAYIKALEDWNKRNLIEVNSVPIDEDFIDLIVTNSMNNNVNNPIHATIFNNQESITIGLILIPSQFDEKNTQEQFIAKFESVRDQFDVLLFMNKDSNFTDFGFKEIVSNDMMTHYRNSYFDFESFKDVFQPKGIIIMRTAITSGSNRAMNAIQSAFAIPDFYINQIVAVKDSILCITSGTDPYTNDEINSVCKYSLDQIKRGNSLIHNTFEDLYLGKDIRVSVFISGL